MSLFYLHASSSPESHAPLNKVGKIIIFIYYLAAVQLALS